MRTINGVDSIPYKSPAQSYQSGSALTFSGWVPKRGPNGGRVVIDEFEIIAKPTDVTVAVAAVEGEDLYRFVKKVSVVQQGGRRRYNGVRGDSLRQFLWHHVGQAQEYADLAIAANQSKSYSISVPMAKPDMLDPFDTSMPADVFDLLEIECADTAELGVGGGTVTIDAMQYYVIAWCHEEYSLVLHAEDVVSEHQLKSTSGDTLKIGGRLHDLLLFARGAQGGAAMANLTDVLIDELRPSALLANPDLTQRWAKTKGVLANLASTSGSQIKNDPVGAGKSVPVIWTGPRTSVYDGVFLSECNLRLTNSVASVIAVTRTMLPKSEQVAAQVMQEYKTPPGAFRVKTRGKTKRNPAEWNDELSIFMPFSARLPSLRVR